MTESSLSRVGSHYSSLSQPPGEGISSSWARTLVWSLWSCSDCAYHLLFVLHQSSVLSHCYFMNFPEVAWESFPKAKAHRLPWGRKGVCCISSIEGDLAEGVCRKDEIGFFFKFPPFFPFPLLFSPRTVSALIFSRTLATKEHIYNVKFVIFCGPGAQGCQVRTLSLSWKSSTPSSSFLFLR